MHVLPIAMNEIIDSVQLGQCVLFIKSKAVLSDTIDVVEVQRISQDLICELCNSMCTKQCGLFYALPIRVCKRC